MTTVPQRIYRFNATSVKILMTFCTELQEAILKKKKKRSNPQVYMEPQKALNSQSYLEEKELS